VYAVGEHEGVHFIAQELVESRRTLSMQLLELRAQPVLPAGHWRETAERFGRLADALQVAHESGVIHRDLKPSNILLAADGTPKIADFGLALVEDALELSRTGDLSGSPFYMSPEQANARPADIDERSDVFSLGATLYEALTLSRPFDGDTVSQVLHKILVVDPPDPREIRSLCPRDLALICLKMLEKEPARRYASMGEVADELRRFTNNEPIRAKPSGLWTRTAKWSRRNPVWAASSAIVCGALVVVTGLLFENHRARTAAEAATAQALASERVAQREAQTSTRVVDFLLEAFNASRPDVARGHLPSARDVLDSGVERIQRELTDPADAGPRARLLESLGQVYSRLGFHQRAAELLREARTLGAATFGPADERTLTIAEEQVHALKDLGRPREAAIVARDVFEARRAAHGPDSEEALRAEGNLGFAEQASGDFEHAEPHLRHSIAGSEKLGLSTAASLLNLGNLMRGRDRLDEAREMVQRAIDAYVAESGADDPDTLNAIEELAKIEGMTGNIARTQELLASTLAMRECIQGPRHPQTLYTRAQIALTHMTDDMPGTIQELREVYARSCASLGPADATSINIGTWLGTMLLRAHADAEAQDYLIATLDAVRANDTQQGLVIYVAMQALADVQADHGRFDLGVSMLEEAIDSAEHTSSNPFAIDLMSERLIDWERALDRDQDALVVARALLARTPADHPRFGWRADLVLQLEASVADH
jgi:tetratricopeptide (TPR) repeat protein